MNRLRLCAHLVALAFPVVACGGTPNAARDTGSMSSGGVSSGGTTGSSGSGGSSLAGGTSSSGGTQGFGGSDVATSGGSLGASGSTGSGGGDASGGSGGSEPVVVANCEGLAAPGTWENIEPSAFHSPSNMQTIVVVVNQQDQSVLAAASNKTNGGDGSTGLYKSTDCGASWAEWNTGAGKEALATGQLWAMLIDPVNPENVYIANGYGSNPVLFKSTNGGVDFSALQTDPLDQIGFVQAVALEAGNPNHIAVTYHDNCQSPRNANCLSQSTDGGETWQVFNGPSEVGGWREAASLSVLGPSSYVYGCDGGVYFTDNGGASWTQVIAQGIFGRYGGSTNLAPDGSLYLGNNQGVWVSTDGANPLGKSWTLVQGSPNPITNLIDDGVRIFGATINGPPFYAADLGAVESWSHLDSPGVSSGSNQMAYDVTHHILYSANFGNGLLRMVTQ